MLRWILLGSFILAGCTTVATSGASAIYNHHNIEKNFHDHYLTLRSYQALEQLLLSPYPLAWLISAKLIAFWLIVILPLLLMTPLLGFSLQLSYFEIFILALSLLLGTPAIIAVGATCKVLMLGLPQQGAFLGLLMLPLTLPVLIIGINILIQLNLSLPILANLAFLGGISLLCFCLLPLAIAAILRWEVM